ncbi:cytochrome [Paenibacillus selenitireducens]|uniref:Cytochrome n=1 Tax=Paenibacillus selenitireducens TaxID=1324314 RepID=A0A1T2X953_9BACL|nr:cytochrome P450 [Paenibacillus selenitireducens]OPA76226.1 cytochrome [Paenibacillus selenitireducens]
MDWNSNEIIPLTWFRNMRDTSPVTFNSDRNIWDVFKYEDVKTVFTRHEIFSSQGSENAEEPIDSSVLRTDPPKHRQLRMLVSQAFTPRVIEGLAPQISTVTQSLFDQAEAQGAVDALESIASPLPIVVIAEMLGVSLADRGRFKSWSDDLVSNDYDKYIQCQKEMSEYFSVIANERRREPQDDLISNLVHANIQGEQLSDIEIIGFCILLLVAGNETTTNLIASAMLCIDSLPDVREQLIADRTLIPSALEEVFRYCSPVQSMFRSVKQDTELRGQQLFAGQFVNMWIGSANHDDEVFEHPDMFNIHRNPNPHLGLGSGIHYCLGSQLARMEAKIVIEALLDRFPHFQRDRSHVLERANSTMMFSLTKLPILLK